MKDVTPGLLEELNKTFEQKLAIHPQIRAYKKKLEAEKLDEKSVALFIREMVSLAATSVASVLRPEKLPDGKLYWNIADGVLVPFLVANSKGYYIATTREEVELYAASLFDRASAIFEVRACLLDQLTGKLFL